MKLNKNYIIIGIVILVLLLVFWRQCASDSSIKTKDFQDTTTSQPSTIIKHKTDTITKILNVSKNKKDTIFIIQKDTIFQEKNLTLIDSLQHTLIFTNKDYQLKIQQEEECVKENNLLKNIQKQKEDSIQILLVTLQILQKERDFFALEKKQEIDKPSIKKEYFVAKNILFTGLFPDAKTEIPQKTIYGGLLKEVLLSMDFMTNIPIKTDNRKQTVYIKISDLQTEQLIYVTEEKPKELYELEDGGKINYSLQTQIILDKNNIANLKITHPMKWTLKRNSAIKVEVFCNKQKIGEHIDEIKSGIPVTTW